MPLNILLADDSVPAQNMGKKILVDAGYSVLTVSNGLEALRKIAESKPDIAILDIFMPGYTGLELCEKLRANAATATLPVVLTVGKLEPYRPEDGEHVHSNAIIVKPFAAAELVSAVRSLIGEPHSEVIPQATSKGHAPEIGAVPLQNASAAAVVSPESAEVSDEQAAWILQQAAQDEPLFSYSQPPALENAEPLASQQGIYGARPVLSNELDGPASLAFNPDAKPTPFSASVTDLLPTAAHSTEGFSSFTEFDLEPESSSDPFMEELAASGASMQEVEPGKPGEEIAPVSAMDIPVLDPLLEVATEDSTPTVVSESSTLEAGETSENVFDEFSPLGEEEHLTPEEKARRIAFEALFNSDEPFPMDESPLDELSAVPEEAIAKQPEVADQSKDQPGGVVPEIEGQVDDRQGEFIAPEPEPLLSEDEAPMSTGATFSDHEALPDELLTASAQEATEPSETAAETLTAPLPQFYEPVDPIPGSPLEIAPPEIFVAAAEGANSTEPSASALSVEGHPFTVPESLESVEAAEIVQPAPDEAELHQSVPEVRQAQTSEQEAESYLAQAMVPEPMSAEPEVVLAPVAVPVSEEIVPVAEEAAPEAVAAMPEPADEVAQLQVSEPESVHLEPEAILEPVPEPEPIPVLTEFVQTERPEPEIQSAEASSAVAAPPIEVPQQLSDEERIGQAVDRVLDRLKRLLVKAVMREMTRPD